MTADAIESGAALGMAIDAKAHVDFYCGHDSIHRFDRAVTFLTLDAGMDMRVVREADEVGHRVDAVPLDFERRLSVVGPRPGDGLDSAAGDSAAVASDASRDRWNTGLRRSARSSMAVLTWDLVDPRVNSMTERNGLNDIRTRRPWPLGESDHTASEDEEQQSERKHCAIHAHDRSSRLRPQKQVHRTARRPARIAEQMIT